MEERKENRIWNFVEFGGQWKDLDTSLLDEISPSWFTKRGSLQNNSVEFDQFIERLKRQHAIETGVVERLYDLDRGVTETLIDKGLKQAFVGHGDTNVPERELFFYLNDHKDAIDFVFDVVKSERPMTVGFVKELHSMITSSQKYAEGRDQFGNRIQVPLLRGKFKERENNPTREDGTLILYCPPEHVEAEMDSLMNLYNQHLSIHPVVLATWFHHAFTTIHPFQDGNGRVVRLLASLILIKNGLFPFTVLREEAREQYILGLEAADAGNPQPLVDYFCFVQRRNIERALNLKSVSSTSFQEIKKAFSQKLYDWQEQKRLDRLDRIKKNRNEVFKYCREALYEAKLELTKEIGSLAILKIHESSPSDEEKNHYYNRQILSFAKKHDYYFNRAFPTAFLVLDIHIPDQPQYRLIVSIHHYGYDNSTLAIGGILEIKDRQKKYSAIPLEIKPYIISVSEEVELSSRRKKLKLYIDDALTLALGHIINEIS